LYLAVALVFFSAIFYVPERMAYSGVVRAVMMIALLGLIKYRFQKFCLLPVRSC
jgi:hypothetical protein